MRLYRAAYWQLFLDRTHMKGYSMIFFEETTEFVPVIENGKIADETGKVYDLTRTVPDAAIAFVMLGIVISITLIILLLYRFMNKNGGHFLSAFSGVMTYLLFSYALYGVFAILLDMIPGMSQFSSDHPVQRVIMITFLTTALAIVGKLIAIKILSTRYDTPGDMLTLGAGFAFANAFSTILYWIMTMTIMLTINQNGGLIKVFPDYDAERMLELAKSYDAMFDMPKEAWMYQSLFTMLLIAFNAYSMIPLYGVFKKQIKPYYAAGVFGIHMVLLVINSLTGKEYIPYMAGFAIEFFAVLISLRFFFVLSKEKLGDMLRPVEKQLNIKNKPKMMTYKNKGHQNFPKFKK